MPTPVDVTFFETPEAFGAWLAENHARGIELWVGFYRTSTGRPSLRWPQAVDEVLCYGWIDGVRKGLDQDSYAIRFTPRRPRSSWSAVNVRRVAELRALGRMHPAGLAVFEARDATAVPYSYARDSIALDPSFEARLRANPAAWRFFTAQPQWYRRGAGHWVMSAKREATRLRRLESLIDESANVRLIKPLSYGRVR